MLAISQSEVHNVNKVMKTEENKQVENESKKRIRMSLVGINREDRKILRIIRFMAHKNRRPINQQAFIILEIALKKAKEGKQR